MIVLVIILCVLAAAFLIASRAISAYLLLKDDSKQLFYRYRSRLRVLRYSAVALLCIALIIFCIAESS